MEDDRCNEPRILSVIGPDGEWMTPADLPRPHTRRWVPRRKARVVAAVEGGLISRQDACARYGLSEEEYESWKAAFARGGLKGLRVTRLRALRQDEASREASPGNASLTIWELPISR